MKECNNKAQKCSKQRGNEVSNQEFEITNFSFNLQQESTGANDR